MEGEINNFILVWTTVVASLCYCHTASRIFPSGISRRLAIFPVICLFFVLPLKLTSVYLGATSCFFIAWLANFKLMLFAFNKGPLFCNPPIPLARFVPLACFPIKLQQSDHQSKKTHKSILNYFTKITILVILIKINSDFKEDIHPHIVLLSYCLYIYFMLEIILAIVAALAKTLIQVDLEPQFNEPYLATSLQDFWGRRWNLMVPNILHLTVYRPVRLISARLLGREWAAVPAILATFLVSGLMHELVIFNFGRLRPTGEMMGFFVIHGLSLSVEIVVKKLVNGKFTVPGIVSGPLTLGFVIYTSFWLFFPPFLRATADVKGCTETLAFVEFVKNHRLVSPNEISCPFL